MTGFPPYVVWCDFWTDQPPNVIGYLVVPGVGFRAALGTFTFTRPAANDD